MSNDTEQRLTTRKRNNIEQTTEYVVKGTDGWNLVTNNPSLAIQESQKEHRDYSKNAVFY